MHENALLQRLPRYEFDIIEKSLSEIELPKGFEVARRGLAIGHIYFMKDGVCAVQSVAPTGERAGAALVGFEGFLPISPPVNTAESSHDVTVLIAGWASRLSVSEFWTIAPHCPALNESLHRFAQNLATQMSYTILTQSKDHMPARLARWLLMVHDRIRRTDIPLTHDDIAQILSVRRPSVTTTLHVLEGERLIRSDRGQIVVLDREGLKTIASNTYGTPEAEYMALFPKPLE